MHQPKVFLKLRLPPPILPVANKTTYNNFKKYVINYIFKAKECF